MAYGALRALGRFCISLCVVLQCASSAPSAAAASAFVGLEQESSAFTVAAAEARSGVRLARDAHPQAVAALVAWLAEHGVPLKLEAEGESAHLRYVVSTPASVLVLDEPPLWVPLEPGLHEVTFAFHECGLDEVAAATAFPAGDYPESYARAAASLQSCALPEGAKRRMERIAGVSALRLRKADEIQRYLARWMPESEGAVGLSAPSAALDGAYANFALSVISIMDAQYHDARSRLRTSLGAWEILGNPSTPTSDSLNALGEACRRSGELLCAIDAFERGLALVDTGSAGRSPHPNALKLSINYAEALRQAGEIVRAERAFRRAFELVDLAAGSDGPPLPLINNYGNLLKGIGDWVAAEREFLKMLEAEPDEPSRARATALNNLAEVYFEQGRWLDAADIQRQALAMRKATHSDGHDEIAAATSNLALILLEQGEGVRALELLHDAEQGMRSQPISYAPRLATIHSLAVAERAGGCASCAVKRLRDTLQEAKHRQVSPSLLLPLVSDLSIALVEAGDVSGAKQVLEEIDKDGALPEKLPELYHLARARTSLVAGDGPGALERLALAVAALEENRSIEPSRQVHLSALEVEIYERYVEALFAVADHSASDPSLTMDSAFRVAQRLQHNSVDQATAQVRASAELDDETLERLVREFRLLREERRVIRGRLAVALGTDDGASDSEQRVTLNRRVRDLDMQLERRFAELETRAPAYFALAAPSALGLAELQSLLEPGESMLSFLFTARSGFVWAVTDEGAEWVRLDLTRATIDKQVDALRTTLDLTRQATPPPYNYALARELYDALIGPVAQSAAMTKPAILINAHAGLWSLPLSVLVEAGEGESARWFGHEKALALVPSVPSFRYLRETDAALQTANEKGRKGLAAWAPTFEGGRAWNWFAELRGNSSTSLTTAQLCESLPPLPDTAVEVRALRRQFRGRKSRLFLREKATAESAMERGLSGALRDYSVLTFATHSVLAKLEGARPEAALAFHGSTGNESSCMIYASDVARWDLNADWVILSACSTGASLHPQDGSAVVGLASGFFYAGAREMLASHWPLASRAATFLTPRVVAYTGGLKAVSKAEALRRALVELASSEDVPYAAHPAVWGAFSLIGDGR